MILNQFEYSEFDGLPIKWLLKPFMLEKVNLLVGKNATGKTNTLHKIVWLANMLAGVQPQLLNSGNYNVEFSDNGEIYHYELKLSAQNVSSEKLTIGEKTMFSRGRDGKGEIVAEQYLKPMKFQLSPNQLVVVSKRDIIQHPYLEKLFTWANGLRFYEFGTSLGRDTFMITNNTNNISVNPRDTNSVVALYVKGKNDFSQFREQIIASMKEIGYDIGDIRVSENPALVPPIPLDSNSYPLMLYVVEKTSKVAVFQNQMSQGMFRAFSLITQLTYNVLSKSSSTVLIDDIGEGLDFERSSGIIKLITRLAGESETQLIMSTNDRFVMNNVPLEYWQVIQRTGGECKVYNNKNSKEKFEDFKYMGLNNFDFLATDFINTKLEKL